MAKTFKSFSLTALLFFFITSAAHAQLDYDDLGNWAFHPDKPGTLLDGFNIDIAVIDENLNTDTLIQRTNNSMINTGVDVFFVHPTILHNVTGFTERKNIPLEDQPQPMIAAGIVGQAGLLSQFGRVFAPRYQQATPPTFINSPLDSTQVEVINTAYEDVKAAFQHYLQHHNNGNKIILASHSQGAFLVSILLRDLFDDNSSLREQLVVAVTAGIVSSYAEAGKIDGGWWENIPRCEEFEQCGCVMTWRSFKEGQTIPFISPGHLTLNPNAANQNLLYRNLNVSNDQLFQDSVYYSTASQPLEYYITLRGNAPYGGNAGFVAFDDFYQIRFQRSGMTRVGFMVEHTPQPNDQRPNPLLDEESNPSFTAMGYHNRDYNIYQWALLQQIDAKLAVCTLTNSVKDWKANNVNSLQIQNGPASNYLRISIEDSPIRDETVKIYDLNGRLILETATDSSGKINTSGIPPSVYFLHTGFGVKKILIQR
ncbi:MAG: DUF3089 domain-containing protein [Chitinophagaceae bacterium]|nr:MAG: DUF3089 domain-containing protein [Chitinophagaceae bacterium]